MRSRSSERVQEKVVLKSAELASLAYDFSGMLDEMGDRHPGVV